MNLVRFKLFPRILARCEKQSLVQDLNSESRGHFLWLQLLLHERLCLPTLYACFKMVYSTLDGTSLKLADKFTYLGSSVSSTEKDIDTRLTKAWTAIDNLWVIWKSDLTDKMKRSFFQAAVVSILLYGCTTWTLTKRLKKKLDGNYPRM